MSFNDGDPGRLLQDGERDRGRRGHRRLVQSGETEGRLTSAIGSSLERASDSDHLEEPRTKMMKPSTPTPPPANATSARTMSPIGRLYLLAGASRRPW